MRDFVPSHIVIQAQTAIHIAAPPEYVIAVYRDVEKWGETFPATIDRAQITQTGDNWKQIEVAHKKEGHVPNTLIILSDNEIGLEESKRKFDASFLNKFERSAGGDTHYVITGYINLKGVYKVLKPFLHGYVRRQAVKQMRSYVLDPLKTAAEKDGS